MILLDLFQLFHVKGSLGYSSRAELYRTLENEMEPICRWKAGWLDGRLLSVLLYLQQFDGLVSSPGRFPDSPEDCRLLQSRH